MGPQNSKQSQSQDRGADLGLWDEDILKVIQPVIHIWMWGTPHPPKENNMQYYKNVIRMLYHIVNSS